MDFCYIRLKDVYLYIPTFQQGQQRLLRRPAFVSSVGAPVSERRGKFHVHALKGISCDIAGGQNLGLLGHNGAGKTSLLRVMAGIYPPSSGTVYSRGSIGCLIEMGTGLSAEMTGNEVIRHQMMMNGADEGEWNAISDEITEFTELGSYLDLPTRTYSNGMQARLIAALATAWPRDILLVDEGLGAGDDKFHEKFSKRLDNYLGDAKLLIIASHNKDLLRQYCTHALVLSRGKSVFYGPIEDAIAYYDSPEYQETIGIAGPEPIASMTNE
jgi:ABC-type polysaccharide/polyol phosphate transport system ATPase subunit